LFPFLIFLEFNLISINVIITKQKAGATMAPRTKPAVEERKILWDVFNFNGILIIYKK